jgi:hypothetical protein
MMNAIESILNSFTPIVLDQMNLKVQLLDRTDTKYLFSTYQLADILSHSIPSYTILSINEKRYGRYETRYFDTPDFSFYTKHHNGRLNRYKVRQRSYIDSNLHFFEIKFKSNKGRTIKKRIKVAETQSQLSPAEIRFLSSNSTIDASMLQEAVCIHYNRITLVSKNLDERVTIDFDLTYRFGNRQQQFPDLIIAEVKQPSNGRSPFRAIMQSFHIQSFPMSKYCFGIASFVPEVKTNLFKPKLHYVNKISASIAI